MVIEASRETWVDRWIFKRFPIKDGVTHYRAFGTTFDVWERDGQRNWIFNEAGTLKLPCVGHLHGLFLVLWPLCKAARYYAELWGLRARFRVTGRCEHSRTDYFLHTCAICGKRHVSIGKWE